MHVLTSRLSPITLRRLAAFKANRRARISLWLFGILFIISLFAELVANDKPIVMQYDGQWYVPLLVDYPETEFGGFLPTRADYLDPFIQQQISDHGWALWPIIPFSYQTLDMQMTQPSPAPPACNKITFSGDACIILKPWTFTYGAGFRYGINPF